jgi:hypothetical protein
MTFLSRLFGTGNGDRFLDFTLQPFVGVGSVRFGMSRDQVRRTMPEVPRSFRKTPKARHETDAFFQNAFQVFYGGDEPAVEFIELCGGLAVRAFYRDLDVFATPADEVVTYISRDAAFDPNGREIPYCYIFRGLQLSLWRPTIPTSADDIDGRCFSTVGIGRRGYYDAA